MIFRFFLPSLFVLLGSGLFAQKSALQGTVIDFDTKLPVRDASVTLTKTGKVVATDETGLFIFEKLNGGKYHLVISAAGFQVVERDIELKSGGAMVLDISLKHERGDITGVTDLPSITLEEAESITDGVGEVANLLHASRDVFQNTASFGWFNFRFRERGYDSENFPLLLNGVSINDPETGISFFGEFGGLNDVLRRRTSSVGLDANDFSFGGIGGATMIDTRASVQRKTTRISYANSNRAYNHRIMVTQNTGLMPNGWAVSASASYRLGDNLLVPGTFFEGYSYFLSVDKKIAQKHTFNITVLGAPSYRGRQTDTNPEMFAVAGNNLYNPSWGYQNGRVRNAAASFSHQPIGIVRYDWTPNRNTALTFSTYGQAGKRADERIEWANAGNPNPDYYRRWPSYFEDAGQQAAQLAFLQSDEKNMQIQWDNFVNANRNNTEVIRNANGIQGNTVTGQRSVYIVEDRRGDTRELGTNLIFRRTLNARTVVNGGANYQYYLGKNFKVVNDLLGGDFWLDINRFAALDFPNEPDKGQSNVTTPNRLVKEGDRFGYDYDENIRKSSVWAQIQYNLPRFQVFVAGEAGQTKFWRTGHYVNGLFPNNSLGDSQKFSYPTGNVKSGVTYKLNGRNYLYANGLIGNRAPQFRDVFLAPRTRNSASSDVETYTTQSFEGGYQLRAPYYKARITGFMTNFLGEAETYQVFAPTVNEFGTLQILNANRRHIGIEAAMEARAWSQWTFTGAVSLGKYQYTNRPTLNFTADNLDQYVIQNELVYQKNFYVPRIPQTAGAVGVKYEGKKFWFASLSLNFRDNFWYDFSEIRRTRYGVDGVENGSEIWKKIIEQEKAPAAYTLDFFGGKSWRIKRKYFVNLNIGVNNILDKKDIIVSGRESFLNSVRDALDPRLYNTEVVYAIGRNYFASVALRF